MLILYTLIKRLPDLEKYKILQTRVAHFWGAFANFLSHIYKIVLVYKTNDCIWFMLTIYTIEVPPYSKETYPTSFIKYIGAIFKEAMANKEWGSLLTAACIF